LIVAFDANILIYFFNENANAPMDAVTGQPVTDCKARIDFLIATLQRNKAKIIIPTPALGEVLVKAQEAAPQWLQLLQKSRYFRIASFDERSAVEFAAMQRQRRATGTKFPATTRAKAKFDDQIVAIATVEGASKIYSDDPDIKMLAGARFDVIGIGDLPLPPKSEQGRLFAWDEDEAETRADPNEM
jgi:predicted nucleic acid-binding protein